MAHRFKNIDRHTPMLLPPDLREWVGEFDLVHFIIAAVERLPFSAFAIAAHSLAHALTRRAAGGAAVRPLEVKDETEFRGFGRGLTGVWSRAGKSA